jgi:hypothetical protein
MADEETVPPTTPAEPPPETATAPEACTCNALPYPHVHDASGIHPPKE